VYFQDGADYQRGEKPILCATFSNRGDCYNYLLSKHQELLRAHPDGSNPYLLNFGAFEFRGRKKERIADCYFQGFSVQDI
jgi:hypothetical protein